MILWRKIEIFHFYHFDSDPRFPPFLLLYVKWKSEVTFVRKCFRDGYRFGHEIFLRPFIKVKIFALGIGKLPPKGLP